MRLAHFVIFMSGLMLGMILFHAVAWPHDWYTNTKNDVTGVRCCGGTDCFEIPAQWISEDSDNYIVTLPNPVPLVAGLAGSYYKPGAYTIPKDQAQPTQGASMPDDGKEHSGYHACIWGGKLRCFFYPAMF